MKIKEGESQVFILSVKHFAGLFSNAKVSKTVFAIKDLGVGGELRRAVAAAAKSLQTCPTLCDPTDGSPPRSSVPGILQARTLEWVAISFSD